MKILQLCKKFPYPLKDGESIAVTYLSRALHKLGAKLTLLAMDTTKHPVNPEGWPNDFNHYEAIHLVKIDNSIKYKDALLNLFSEDSYHVSRFISRGYSLRLIQLLQEEEYDIIQLETLYLAPYIPTIKKYAKGMVVMRAHNIEFEIWDRIAQHTSFLPKKWYLHHLTQKLRNFELAQFPNYDLLIAITERDLQKYRALGYSNPAHVTPIGLNIANYMADDGGFYKNLEMSFIGSLDWMPNIEGLIWFLDAVWPILNERFPHLKLNIAGRNTPPWLFEKTFPNVQIHGEVPDAIEFINRYPIMIVPLLAGSGMRAKILEGMALGKVVISTSIGAEGIDATHGDQILIADSPEDFEAAIEDCFGRGKNLVRMGQKAQVFVSDRYDNYNIARSLLNLYQEMLVKV